MRSALASNRAVARLQSTSAQFCQRRWLTTEDRYVKVSEEIQQAVSEKRPVVALESTIYTHGFPYPQNMVLATNLESIVRSTGAVPATIGILDGVARVGLDGDDLIRLASSSQTPEQLLKVSRRDLSYSLSAKTADGQPYTGGTTVAGTVILAHLAGIRVFATGGLGGVHRGASETFDVSADLTELGRTPVSVIAAGCKAFLDIPKTLEYLETQGIAVATFADGRHGDVDFPGFWSRDSGMKSPLTIANEQEAAQMILAQHALGLQSGLLFANPVPQEYEIPLTDIQSSIDAALAEAGKQGMTGNRATPFILAKIKQLTGSRSVTTNTALVEHNVRVGARIAMEVSFLEKYRQSREVASKHSGIYSLKAAAGNPAEKDRQASSHEKKVQTSAKQSSQASPQVLVAGMLAIDFNCDYSPRKESADRPLEMQTSNPARVTQSLGGVGHNVARAIDLCGVDCRLLSAVGSDMNGSAAVAALSAEGLDHSGVVTLPADSGRRTAQYVAVNDQHKDLIVAMADMDILEHDAKHSKHIAEAFTSSWLSQLQQKPSYLVLDANWSPEYLARWLNGASSSSTRVLYEPVSNAKSIRLFHLPKQESLGVYPSNSVRIGTPNEHELSSMYDTAKEKGFFDRPDWWQVVDAFGIPSSGARAKMVMATSAELVDRGIPQKALQLLPYLPCMTVKLGAQGVLLVQIIPADDPRLDEPSYAGHLLSRCTNGSEKDLKVGGVYLRLFPPSEVLAAADVVSVNGVGDTFAGALVAGLARRVTKGEPERIEDLIDIAQTASLLTLQSSKAVSPDVSSIAKLL